jgi:hypothetical protein
MTAATMDATVGSWLERRHARWLEEVVGTLDAARAGDAGIWVRWGAVRYLDTAFAARLQREREAIEAIRPRLLQAQSSTLWALAELLEQLRHELDRAVALHWNGEEFSRVTVKFLRALGCWCRESERALSHTHWPTLTEGAREKFRLITDDAELPAA